MEKCILVVDDDMMNLKRTKLILEKQYDLVLAKSGEEALDKLKEGAIDLILLDIEMKEDNVEVPVIFLTASGDEDDVVAAISLGAVNYLKKPFLPKELRERIAKELEKE